MKKNIWIFVIGLILFSCNKGEIITVSVSNPLPFDRMNEMVELSLPDIQAKLQIDDTQLVIRNDRKEEIPYQITSDKKLIFQASVPANAEVVYAIDKGVPSPVTTITCGKQYPERVDDIAWENDLVAFRTYGPALQKSGERAFGYDLWTKYNTTKPVVEERYAKDLNPEIDYSYHRDYGYGLDCYKVGPTLGGGTAALMPDGNIVYPYCYKDYEILDNGPLRFSVKLTYNPLLVKDNPEVIEIRVITLDAGSHLNKTTVAYSGLTEITDVTTGIVLHEPENEVKLFTDSGNTFMSYADPTENPNIDNGKIFVGVAFTKAPKAIKALYFSEEQKQKERGGANGHLLGISDYQPGSEYVYYWGSGWSKAGIDFTGWNKYMDEFAQKLAKPLVIALK